MAAVRRLAYEAADSGLLSPELAAGIHRVKGVRKLGSRLGNWLTVGEAAALWQVPDGQTLTGKRNRAILAILLGCGLRRRELAELTLESLQRREERWVIVDLYEEVRQMLNEGFFVTFRVIWRSFSKLFVVVSVICSDTYQRDNQTSGCISYPKIKHLAIRRASDLSLRNACLHGRQSELRGYAK